MTILSPLARLTESVARPGHHLVVLVLERPQKGCVVPIEDAREGTRFRPANRDVAMVLCVSRELTRAAVIFGPGNLREDLGRRMCGCLARVDRDRARSGPAKRAAADACRR
jgi:hypothetical protein